MRTKYFVRAEKFHTARKSVKADCLYSDSSQLLRLQKTETRVQGHTHGPIMRRCGRFGRDLCPALEKPHSVQKYSRLVYKHLQRARAKPKLTVWEKSSFLGEWSWT